MVNEYQQECDWSLTTRRLRIIKARPTNRHVEFLFALWTDSRVMHFVGFPKGLKIDRLSLRAQLHTPRDRILDVVLLVTLTETGEPIGECNLGSPDQDNIAHTDVKLSPSHWGHRYGIEIKQVLVDYLFQNTECAAIRATPNKQNEASINMQEAVGGKQVGEGCYQFPEDMRDYTTDVEYYEYRVYREDWAGRPQG